MLQSLELVSSSYSLSLLPKSTAQRGGQSAMELTLSIPNGGQNPSIEIYKLALRHFENAISERPLEKYFASSPGSDGGDGGALCSYCVAVGERLKDVCYGNDEAQEFDFGVSARDSSDNLHLGSLKERGEIYMNARSKGMDLHGLTLTGLLRLVYAEKITELENEVDWIIDPFSESLQLSLSTIISDGTLSIWWPENTVDEINDEPTQIPMLAADHKAVFTSVKKPWIPLPSGKISTKRDLGLFSDCFNSCLQNHEKCRETQMTGALSSGFGPSRLIDIVDMKIVKMGIDEAPKYFILSYVWGRPPFLLLEKTNEKEFSTPGSLKTQRIPQTILDAMEVTRRFEIRYLWVDALCIVQDDLENKMHEIDRMHTIYAQAEMTIVAATGDGANSGLLDIDSIFTDAESHLINEIRFTVDSMDLREVIEFSTWFTRGWTFQELVFSKRILYFMTERTYYSCEEGSWSEDFPLLTWDVDENGDAGEVENKFYDESLKTDFDFRNKLDPFENYTAMVSKMSTRQFTQESDCLNACRRLYTGLLLKGLGGSVCGIPAICFEFGLAWQPEGNLTRRGSQNSSATTLQFPTWSWAGWKGQIEYPFLAGPEKCGVKGEVRWAIYEAYEPSIPMTDGDATKAKEKRYKQVVPTIKVHTSPSQSHQSMSSWYTHSYSPTPGSRFPKTAFRATLDVEGELESRTRKIMSSNFIGPSILLFQTYSITCQIDTNEISRPPLARHKDLRFFTISSLTNNEMIGELKIDYTTLNTFLESQDSSNSTSTIIQIELISLFEIDFGSSSVQNLMWMNTHSARGTFSKEFMEMVEEMEDKRMKCVMWIVWDEEEGVAMRVAVGWVSVEGWQEERPRLREVLLE
ncbi:heterokaryon incompatibility protein [Botrytis cinerea]